MQNGPHVLACDAMASFIERRIDELEIEDEVSFKHVGLYADLKKVLASSSYRFRILPPPGLWSRALFLNLTFWGPEGGGDVLPDELLPADVVTHVAWHHLAARELGPTLPASALFLGESIASAFDLYLVGRLLGHASRSSFLETQVPALQDAALSAGCSEEYFEALLESVSGDPERAFEDLRQLLFDAPTALSSCSDSAEALVVLSRFEDHRFGMLLHHYEVSNWVLYAKAYAAGVPDDGRAIALDGLLRDADVSLELLEKRWLGEPAGECSGRGSV